MFENIILTILLLLCITKTIGFAYFTYKDNNKIGSLSMLLMLCGVVTVTIKYL